MSDDLIKWARDYASAARAWGEWRVADNRAIGNTIHGWCPECGGAGTVVASDGAPDGCPNVDAHRSIEYAIGADRPPGRVPPSSAKYGTGAGDVAHPNDGSDQ